MHYRWGFAMGFYRKCIITNVLLAAPGGPWRPLAAPGGLWRALAASGGPLRQLAAPGGPWPPLAVGFYRIYIITDVLQLDFIEYALSLWFCN